MLKTTRSPNFQEGEATNNIELTSVSQVNDLDLEQNLLSQQLEVISETVPPQLRGLRGGGGGEMYICAFLIMLPFAILSLAYNIHWAIKTDNDPNASTRDKALEWTGVVLGVFTFGLTSLLETIGRMILLAIEHKPVF